MKRAVLVFPFLGLMFFSACESFVGEISPAEWTAMVSTQTATMWTPTVTPTFHSDVSRILKLLNEGLPQDDLEMAIDARYTAVDVWFPYKLDTSSRIFHIEIRCECVTNSQCCTSQHMFVLAMRALQYRADDIMEQVPENVIRVDVACFQNSRALGVLSAPWSEVKEYIKSNLDGYILGWHVTPNPPP